MKKDEARIVPEVHFSFNDHPFRKPSFVLYFCGCPHKCKGCHSQELQNPYSDLCETITVFKSSLYFPSIIMSTKSFSSSFNSSIKYPV